MKRVVLAVCVLAAVVVTAVALAQGRDELSGKLDGFQEVPSVSSDGRGTFRAELHSGGTEIEYRLRYSRLEGEVQQAHIHFGQRGVDGGVSAFLCSNAAGAPAGTQPCPDPPATVTGTLRAADVVGPAAQGIAAGEIAELVRAIRAGVAYANVHTDKFPDGEVRGQIKARKAKKQRRNN